MENKITDINGVRYLKVMGFDNRQSRQKASHDARSNRDARRKGHRMNRPQRMDLVSVGGFKLREFFNIN